MILEQVQALTHSDCRNCITVDVAKGMCRRTNDIVLIDAAACDSYQQLPKCKFCVNFRPGSEGLGTCTAEAGQPWAYAEMIAVTCAMFKAA